MVLGSISGLDLAFLDSKVCSLVDCYPENELDGREARLKKISCVYVQEI